MDSSRNLLKVRIEVSQTDFISEVFLESWSHCLFSVMICVIESSSSAMGCTRLVISESGLEEVIDTKGGTSGEREPCPFFLKYFDIWQFRVFSEVFSI